MKEDRDRGMGRKIEDRESKLRDIANKILKI